ncbi:hypothetical protein KKG48_04450 [Patescibacteria group bacterium]|nr:hypothetical protein [Patescibacteria group bacterium]
MIKLMQELSKRPRGRACILLTHDYADQKEWAMELAKQTGSEYVDLLDHFKEKRELAEKISSLNVTRLFSLLRTISDKSVLIVTGMEFLKATWSAQNNALEDFAKHVETWTKSPAMLFVLQFDSTLAERKFTRYPQYQFMVDQKETYALT